MRSKEGICCFTGHRIIADEALLRLPQLLEETIARLVASGITVFRAGGAVGFDTIAALKVLEQKKKYPFLRLELYLPCRDQAKGWNGVNQSAYRYVMERADSVTFLYETYVHGCMHARNRALVEGADVCVAYCLSETGGTAYTVSYAQKKGLRLIRLV